MDAVLWVGWGWTQCCGPGWGVDAVQGAEWTQYGGWGVDAVLWVGWGWTQCGGGWWGGEEDAVEPGPPFLGHPGSIWPHWSWRGPGPPCEYPICSSPQSSKPRGPYNPPLVSTATASLTRRGPHVPHMFLHLQSFQPVLPAPPGCPPISPACLSWVAPGSCGLVTSPLQFSTSRPSPVVTASFLFLISQGPAGPKGAKGATVSDPQQL